MSEATTTPSTGDVQATAGEQATGGEPPGGRSFRSTLAALELDTRLLGMIVALAVIWVLFNILSGGSFLTPRNLWNLSVQSASIAIMATGMVLIIVSRNIDLSVGSMLGLIGYVMAMIQVVWLPQVFGVSYNEPWIWVVALAAGILLGAAMGAVTGSVVAYLGVPSFIVTLGGLLIWRGLIFRFQQGQTLSPLNEIFQLLGGGPKGSLGATFSWILGAIICVGIIYTLWAGRRRKKRYGFPGRPLWAEVVVGVIGCGVVLAVVYLANSYMWPPALATQWAKETGNVIPPGGIPTGIAIPVVIMLLVGLVMTYLATRRRFGRYVYAIGGNPDAAELGGINVRATIMKNVHPHGHPRGDQRGGADGAPQLGGHQPGRPERARRHRGSRHRWHLVRGRHRHHPRRDPGRGRHAVAALGHAPAQRRLADPGRRGGHGPRRGRRLRLLPPASGRLSAEGLTNDQR